MYIYIFLSHQIECECMLRKMNCLDGFAFRYIHSTHTLPFHNHPNPFTIVQYSCLEMRIQFLKPLHFRPLFNYTNMLFEMPLLKRKECLGKKKITSWFHLTAVHKAHTTTIPAECTIGIIIFFLRFFFALEIFCSRISAEMKQIFVQTSMQYR